VTQNADTSAKQVLFFSCHISARMMREEACKPSAIVTVHFLTLLFSDA